MEAPRLQGDGHAGARTDDRGSHPDLSSDVSVEKAARVIARRKHNRLPVVAHGRRVGVVTRVDVLDALIAESCCADWRASISARSRRTAPGRPRWRRCVRESRPTATGTARSRRRAPRRAGGASWLAVATAGEASGLRAAGLGGPLLVIGALSDEELPIAPGGGRRPRCLARGVRAGPPGARSRARQARHRHGAWARATPRRGPARRRRPATAWPA
jgi:hypothetical protein